jgi:ubiquinone/menaquinone biosynthesis C-methylase UbiE
MNYDTAAAIYDATRGVSPSILAVLSEALGPVRGRSLLDIGGGTGNYALSLAQTGFRSIVLDASPGMLQRAAAKLGPQAVVLGDARRLPLAQGSFDCAISVNVLHHLPDWPTMLTEARRVVREGPFALLAGFREVRVLHYDQADDADLSLQAMGRRPEKLLDETHRLNTSFFRRLPESEHRDGIAALRRDLHSGGLQAVISEYELLRATWRDGAIFVASPQ